MTGKWDDNWQYKRRVLTSRGFGLEDVIKSQYHKIDKKIAREKELARLKSSKKFVNPATDPQASPVPYFASKFCHQNQYSNIFATADEEGHLALYNIQKPGELLCQEAVVKNAIFDILWVPGETKILALCGDHTSRLFDVGEAQITEIAGFDGHFKSVKSGDFSPCDSAVFATGSRDGQVLLFDSRASLKPGRVFYSADQCVAFAAGGKIAAPSKKTASSVSASVTALSFQDTHSLLVCGSMDEYIRTWDLRMTHCSGKVHSPRCLRKTAKKGYNDLKISADKTRMYVSSLGGPIFCFNLNSLEETPVAEFHGHDTASFYVKTSLSADGEYLASGSTDHSVRVWRTRRAELESAGRKPMLRLSGHNGEVTGVDISSAPTFSMVSCGEDGTFRTWLPTAVFDHQEPLAIDVILAELSIDPPSTVERRVRRLATPSELPTEQTEVSSATPCDITSQIQKRSQASPPTAAVSAAAIFKRKIEEYSPKRDVKRITLSPSKLNEYKSPTLNLPNYVIEGTGPWHSCPRVRQKENLNWLTEIRRKSADKRSSSVEMGKRRRSINSKRPASRRTLLEYYTKSSKANEEPLKSEPL